MGGRQGDGQSAPSGILGSLREALAAASREQTAQPMRAVTPELIVSEEEAKAGIGSPPLLPEQSPPGAPQKTSATEIGGTMSENPTQPHNPESSPSAADAAREARGGTPNIPPVSGSAGNRERHIEFDTPPTTRVVREEDQSLGPANQAPDQAHTQMLRGKQQVKRGTFSQDPVVGWVVVVGGPGLGAHRPIYEGNNALGRSSSQRIPIDFGDDAISAEEQCYIRYDSAGRSFLFVPNLAKANVVGLNDTRPSGAVTLQAMDVVTVGRTQLVFMPFCGAEFDWSDIDQET